MQPSVMQLEPTGESQSAPMWCQEERLQRKCLSNSDVYLFPMVPLFAFNHSVNFVLPFGICWDVNLLAISPCNSSFVKRTSFTKRPMILPRNIPTLGKTRINSTSRFNTE